MFNQSKHLILVSIILLGAFLAMGVGLSRPGSAHAEGIKNPLAGNAEAIAAGQAIFLERCSECHSDDGSGISGPSLIDDEWWYGGTDEKVFESVTKGRSGAMSGWRGTLTENQIWSVIAFLRTIQK